MISILVCLVNSRIAAERVFSAAPWIPPPWRKPRGGHPRGPFPGCFGSPLAHARLPRYFGPSHRPTNLPISTVLTDSLQLDSSYEASIPPRLDSIMRQHVKNR